MAKRALNAGTVMTNEARLISVRLPIGLLEQISTSLKLRGLGKKGRSKWFSEALMTLGEMAKEDEEGYLGSLNLYNNQSNLKQIQIALRDEAQHTFDNLLQIASLSSIEKDGLITKLIFMTAHLQLLSEGIIVVEP